MSGGTGIKRLKMKFCIAQKTDSESIMKLYKSMVGREGVTWSDDYPSMETLIRDISRENEFCLKDDDDKIVAAIAIDEDEEVDRLDVWNKSYKRAGELARLAVRTDEQNNGIARKMIENVVDIMKERSYDAVHFLASKTNLPALASYKKLDIPIVGEAVIYGENWWCYEKALKE